MSKLILPSKVIKDLMTLANEGFFFGDINMLKILDTSNFSEDELTYVADALKKSKEKAKRQYKNQREILTANIELSKSKKVIQSALAKAEVATKESNMLREIAEEKTAELQEQKNIINIKNIEIKRAKDQLSKIVKQQKNQLSKQNAFILKSKESDNLFWLRKNGLWILAGVIGVFTVSPFLLMGALKILGSTEMAIFDKQLVLIQGTLRTAEIITTVVATGLLSMVIQNTVKADTKREDSTFSINDNGDLITELTEVGTEVAYGINSNPPHIEDDNGDDGDDKGTSVKF